MTQRVILIGNQDNGLINGDYEVVANFDSIGAALGQSVIFQPEIFLLDVDDESNVDAVPEFLNAYPAVEIICTLTNWNNDIVKKCTRLGAEGCILKSDNFVDSIKLLKKRGVKTAKTVAFFSPKGFSGKTTFIANLGANLARESGENVGIIDADLEFGDMAMLFSANPANTIIDAASANSPVSLDKNFTKLTGNLKLLSSPKRLEMLDSGKIADIIKMSGNIFRYVLIDLEAGINPVVVEVCGLADIIFAMGILNSGYEIEHMKRALKYFETKGKRVNVIFSKVMPYTEQARRELAVKLNYPDVTILPEDKKLAKMANDGKILERSNSPTTNRFRRLARALMGAIDENDFADLANSKLFGDVTDNTCGGVFTQTK